MLIEFPPMIYFIEKESKMTKWEYLTFSRVAGSWTDDKLDGRSPQQKLSDHGMEGWELVSVCYDTGGYNFYLKRPLTAKKKVSTVESRATTRSAKKKM
jgi:hypothetical protein